ncbi:MAG: hypothetical protein RLZZ241_1553 [Bacteroidota bacterium]|jgi:predicted amidohydrolase
MEIALIQTDLNWENPEANRRHLETVFRNLSSNLDLIVLPEMFTTGFTMNPNGIDSVEAQHTLDWMQHWSERLDAAIVGSLVWPEQAGYRNRLIFMTPEGEYSVYDKRHTFTLAGEDRVYNRGTERVLIQFRGLTFMPLICYDLRFPVWSRYREHYDVLLYVANWPEPRIAAWDILLRARAIENMSYVVGVNRTGTDSNANVYPGHSAVYDALGKRLGYSDIQEVIYATLHPEHISDTRSKLKFLNDRDTFNLEL